MVQYTLILTPAQILPPCICSNLENAVYVFHQGQLHRWYTGIHRIHRIINGETVDTSLLIFPKANKGKFGIISMLFCNQGTMIHVTKSANQILYTILKNCFSQHISVLLKYKNKSLCCLTSTKSCARSWSTCLIERKCARG